MSHTRTPTHAHTRTPTYGLASAFLSEQSEFGLEWKKVSLSIRSQLSLVNQEHTSVIELCSYYLLTYLSISADFANFEIGKLLGAGSFGEVVAATRKNDNVPVCSFNVIFFSKNSRNDSIWRWNIWLWRKGWIILENNILQAACTCAKKIHVHDHCGDKTIHARSMSRKRACYTDRRYLIHARQRKIILSAWKT